MGNNTAWAGVCVCEAHAHALSCKHTHTHSHTWRRTLAHAHILPSFSQSDTNSSTLMHWWMSKSFTTYPSWMILLIRPGLMKLMFIVINSCGVFGSFFYFLYCCFLVHVGTAKSAFPNCFNNCGFELCSSSHKVCPILDSNNSSHITKCFLIGTFHSSTVENQPSSLPCCLSYVQVELGRKQEVVVYDQNSKEAGHLSKDGFVHILMGKLEGTFHKVSLLTGNVIVCGARVWWWQCCFFLFFLSFMCFICLCCFSISSCTAGRCASPHPPCLIFLYSCRSTVCSADVSDEHKRSISSVMLY